MNDRSWNETVVRPTIDELARLDFPGDDLGNQIKNLVSVGRSRVLELFIAHALGLGWILECNLFHHLVHLLPRHRRHSRRISACGGRNGALDDVQCALHARCIVTGNLAQHSDVTSLEPADGEIFAGARLEHRGLCVE